MKTLGVQLTVRDYPELDQSARAKLRNSGAFETLSVSRSAQVWGGFTPTQFCFTAQVQDTAVFVSADWEVAIHSRRLIDCVSALCSIINVLGQEFVAPIEISLLDTDLDTRNKRSDALYRQLSRERALRRVRAIRLWLLTIVVGGFAGVLLQWIFTRGS